MRSHAARTLISHPPRWQLLDQPEVAMQELIFHTVHEAAQILRVDAATIYRSIRSGSFPAVRIRSRYVIPATALREVAERAVGSGTWVDLADPAASTVQGRRVGRFGMREPRISAPLRSSLRPMPRTREVLSPLPRRDRAAPPRSVDRCPP